MFSKMIIINDCSQNVTVDFNTNELSVAADIFGLCYIVIYDQISDYDSHKPETLQAVVIVMRMINNKLL